MFLRILALLVARRPALMVEPPEVRLFRIMLSPALRMGLSATRAVVDAERFCIPRDTVRDRHK